MSKEQPSKIRAVDVDLSSEKDLETPRTAHLQKRFKMPSTKVRRSKVRAQRAMKHEEDKAAANSKLKDKGIWSYDWRIPLQALEKCSQCLGSGAEVPAASLPSIRRFILGEKPQYRQVQVKDIPRPQVWSASTFTAYVEHLTQSATSRHMNRYLYAEGQSHVTIVESTLKMLFTHSSLRGHLTIRSFNEALVFFYKHNMISSVRMFFTLMEKLHMDTSAETFNIMLRGASSRKDLHNFTFLLRTMITKGIRPTADTWIALIVAVHSKAAKLCIVRSMRERGFMDRRRIVKSVLSHLLPPEIVSYVESGRNIPTLFQDLDRKYEPGWLSVSAGNQMCQKLGENGLMPEALEVLDLMVDRGCLPDKVTLMIFLGHCRRQRDMGGAKQILDWFHSMYGLNLKEDVLDILFTLAWRSCYYNCCRVIWRVACVHGAVSYRMQQLVMRSLIRNTPEQPQTRAQHWMKSIGKVVIGINLRTTHDADDLGMGLEIMKKLVDRVESGIQRAASLRLAKLMLVQDLEAAKQFDLNGVFTGLLDKALDLDRKWGLGNIHSAKSTLWKVQNAIKVDVIRKGKNPLQSRGES
ncbi:MAG: hypothetical protein Q9187_005299 [Circinaria calcarea]